MAAADTRAIDSGTPGAVLMERAGRACARAVIRLAGGRYGKRVAVVCGKGNNGGDGFAVARVLIDEGLGVDCFFVGDASSLKGDPAHHRDRLVSAGGSVTPFAPEKLRDADVIVDALFGTGFRGRAEGDAAAAIEAVNAHGGAVVAVDIPSGVDGTTGRVEGPAVQADVTVAMAAQKIGTAVGEGAAHSGEVEVVNIGIPVDKADAWWPEDADSANVLPERTVDAHKRSAGSVALLCGSAGMSGAAILAARGAIRMGAGYATLGLTKAIESIVSSALPEVLTEVVTDEDVLGPAALDGFKPVLERADAVGIGPGLGQGDTQRSLVKETLGRVGQPLVLDADALNVLAGDTSALQERDQATVLTPHPAELARLLEMETAQVQADRLAAARTAARRFRCFVILKGYRSVIARPDGTVIVNPTGTSHLATAGTGDVLTGAVAALLAGGVDPFDAAWCAAYVHGVAGEVAAARHGGGGVIAWDVAEALPEAIGLIG